MTLGRANGQPPCPFCSPGAPEGSYVSADVRTAAFESCNKSREQGGPSGAPQVPRNPQAPPGTLRNSPGTLRDPQDPQVPPRDPQGPPRTPQRLSETLRDLPGASGTLTDLQGSPRDPQRPVKSLGPSCQIRRQLRFFFLLWA
nr:basic salivary proline-rich protein 1-like [Procambarus clarkii]